MKAFLNTIVFITGKSFRRRLKKNFILAFGIIGTAALMLNIEAFINGISESMINNSVKLYDGHIKVDFQDNADAFKVSQKIKKLLPSAKVFKRQQFKALLSDKGDNYPVSIAAFMNPLERNYSVFEKRIIQGAFPVNNGECLIGEGLADLKGIKLEETLKISTGNIEKSFRVSGIFKTSVENFDKNFILVNSLFAAKPGFAALYFSASEETQAALDILQKNLSKVNIVSWEDQLTELYQLIVLNKKAMNITEFLVLMIIIFSIAGMVSLAVVERYKEIALFKLKGFSSLTVAVFIIAELLLTAFFAAVAGLCIGYCILLLWMPLGIDLSEVTSSNRHFLFSSKVYPLISIRILVVPFITVMMAALICSFFAIFKALGIKSTDVIKGR